MSVESTSNFRGAVDRELLYIARFSHSYGRKRGGVAPKSWIPVFCYAGFMRETKDHTFYPENNRAMRGSVSPFAVATFCSPFAVAVFKMDSSGEGLTLWFGNLPPTTTAEHMFWFFTRVAAISPSEFDNINLYSRSADASSHCHFKSKEAVDKVLQFNGKIDVFENWRKPLDIRPARAKRTQVIIWLHTPVLMYTYRLTPYMHLCSCT